MNIYRHIVLFLISILLACCYNQVFIDVPKNHLFKFKQTFELSAPELKLDFKIEPSNYLLKIRHQLKPGQEKNICFNKQIIFPFHTRKSNTHKNNFFYNEISYFQIKSNQIQESNSLNIEFNSSFPSSITIYFQNFRKSFYNDKILIFFKPVSFAVPSIRAWITSFLIIYGFLITLFFHLNRTFNKALPYVLIFLCIMITVLGPFAINNFSSLFQYIICVKPFEFWFYLSPIPLVLLLRAIIKKRSDIAQETQIDILFLPFKQRLTIPVFLGLFTILFLLRFIGALQNRVPMGHDTFQYMLLQYNIFFNEPALRGSIPQWLPFMTHGTLSHIWVLISQGLLTSILVPFVNFFKNINFFYIFQAGLLFDEFVLLLGCTLLAKRCFKSSAAILFVASSMTFTTISSTQIWYDFHLVYLMPLTLYCFSRVLQDISAKYILLAGLLSTGMFLGCLPYHPPLFGFTILTFCLILFLYDRTQIINNFKNFKLLFNWRYIPAIAIPCFLAILLCIFMKRGVEEIISCNTGRSENFAVQYKDFINYGGYVNLRKFWEFISRYSNNIDNTVYGGLLLVPFIILTLLRVRSRLSYVFGITAIVMALFSAGILVPLIFYYMMPLGKYYRHIGLVAPLVKLFVVFYAGFGFDTFWFSLKRLKISFSQGIFSEEKADILIVLMVMLYIFVLVLIQRFSNLPVFDFSSWSLITESQLYLSREQISRGMNLLLIIGGLFIILMLLMLLWPRRITVLGVLFISVHLIDVVSFKFEREYQRVPCVNKSVIALFNTYDYSFRNTRNQDYFSNDRFLKLVPYLFKDELPFRTDETRPTIGRFGAVYWDLESFLFFDAVSSIFHTRHWLRGIDQFYRAWIPPSKWDGANIGFPIPQTYAFKKISGYDFPKLQLFSKIHILPTENDIAEIMKNSDFQGDILLSSGLDLKQAKIDMPIVFNFKDNINLLGNERISDAEISVQEFSFNKLRVLVNNNSGTTALLYYADAWHPRWHAYVNGKDSPVLKTNLAYKSVMVPPGNSEVIFQFGNSISKLLSSSLIAAGILVSGGIIYLLFTELLGRNERK